MDVGQIQVANSGLQGAFDSGIKAAIDNDLVGTNQMCFNFWRTPCNDNRSEEEFHQNKIIIMMIICESDV